MHRAWYHQYGSVFLVDSQQWPARPEGCIFNMFQSIMEFHKNQRLAFFKGRLANSFHFWWNGNAVEWLSILKGFLSYLAHRGMNRDMSKVFWILLLRLPFVNEDGIFFQFQRTSWSLEWIILKGAFSPFCATLDWFPEFHFGERQSSLASQELLRYSADREQVTLQDLLIVG